MLPPPSIPWHGQRGMLHPALTQAWAYKGLCLAVQRSHSVGDLTFYGFPYAFEF